MRPINMLSIAIFLLATAVPSAPAQSLAPQQIISSLTSLCLQPQGGSIAEGTPIVQELCAPIAAQEWFLVGMSNGHYQLKNAQNLACMDAFGASVAKAPVQLRPCEFITNESWDLGDPNGARLLSRSGGHTFCLEVAGGVTTAGQFTQIYGCNGTTSQLWRLRPTVFFVVPKVVQQVEQTAISTLALYGLGYTAVDQGKCTAIGVVTGQSPNWGTIQAKNTKVIIYFNSGKTCKT
jgi:hypothetical protein